MSQLSNLKLSKRWGCFPSTFYHWRTTRVEALRILTAGSEFLECRKIVAPDEFETICNEHGFSGGELVRASGFSLNTIKSWSRSEHRVARFWDLIRGYQQYVINR